MDTSHATLKWRWSLRPLLAILDEWIFAEPDRQARRNGWEIRRPALFIRVYRNPAFGRCRECRGEGFTRKGVCAHCLGSGRGRP